MTHDQTLWYPYIQVNTIISKNWNKYLKTIKPRLCQNAEIITHQGKSSEISCVL